MLNQQHPEKRIHVNNRTIDLHSIFKTIQGEGPFCGVPCVFIRLAGCNLQCPKCDTEYTEGRRTVNMIDIVDQVKKMQSKGLIVVTGGEPFRQANLITLLNMLIDEGYYIQIETNGTLAIPEPAVRIQRLITLNPHGRYGIYIVCSPKTGRVHPSVAEHACAFKYVGGQGELSVQDGLPITALDHTAKPILYRPNLANPQVPIYLQPLDDKDPVQNELNLKACVESCLKFGYTLQLQTHKIINVE